MKILALEFSSSRRSVAIVEVSDGGSETLAEIADSDFRGKTGLVLLSRALEDAHLTPPAIDLIAIGLGPGSYTGIRSSIAIAQGWQLGRQTPTVGISSVELLARQATESGINQKVQIIIDAQRNEVYSAIYDHAKSPPALLRPLEIIPASQLQRDTSMTIMGPEATRFAPEGIDVAPSAVTLAKLAASNTQTAPAEQLEPIYLRPTSFVKAPPPRLI